MLSIATWAVVMAVLTVRNLESEVVEQLRARAAKNGRSAEAEHREILRRELCPPSEELKRRWAAADLLEAFRQRTGGRGGPSSLELIREGRIERTARVTGLSVEEISEIM